MAFGRRVLLALAVGYIFFFYSERMFWSYLRSDDAISLLVLGWLLYAVFAYMTLIVIEYFRVRTIYALFLAGCVFGWIVEGIYAMTFFGGAGIPLPFSIVWTAAAWHALISVVLGWYLLQRSLAERSYLHTLTFSGLFGLFWGVWAIAWIYETPPISTTPFGFISHACITTALLVLAFWLSAAKGNPATFVTTRLERYVLGAIAIGFFALITVPTVSHLALILVAAFAYSLFFLYRHKKAASGAPIMEIFQKRAPVGKYACLFFMPLVASVIYLGLNAAGLLFRSNLPLLISTSILGTLALAVSAYKVTRGKGG